jgi:hypothetical protein
MKQTRGSVREQSGHVLIATRMILATGRAYERPGLFQPAEWVQ